MTDKSVSKTVNFTEILENIGTCPREELGRYISDLIFSCNAENQDIHDTTLHQGYIALLQKHIPDQGRLKEILVGIARRYIHDIPFMDPAIAMMYTHAALTGLILPPEELQEQLYDNLQREDEKFGHYLKGIEPYFALLFKKSIVDINSTFENQYLPQRTRDEYKRNRNKKIPDPRGELSGREQVVERICTDTKKTPLGAHKQFTIDREDTDIHTGSYESPDPDIDFITVGKVFSYRTDQLLPDVNDKKKRLTNLRNAGPGLYYELAMKSNFPQHPQKVIAMIQDCLAHNARSVIPYGMHALAQFSPDTEVNTYHIGKVADCMQKCIDTYENNNLLAQEYEKYLLIWKKNALEQYIHLPVTPISLQKIATLGNSLGALALYIQDTYLKDTAEPELPESTVNKEHFIQILTETEKQAQHPFLNEFNIYLQYLELAIYLAKQQEFTKAEQALEKGKEVNFAPGYGQYTAESLDRQQKLDNYLTYHNTKLYQEYGLLAKAIDHYLAQGKDSIYTDTYCNACLTIGKRYIKYGQETKAREFLSLATYATDKKITTAATKLLEKIPPQKTTLYEE